MAYTLIKKWRSTWKSRAKQRRAADHRRKNPSTAGRSNVGDGDRDSQASRDEEPIARVLVLSDGKDTKSDASAHL